jgi:hypothetical protein
MTEAAARELEVGDVVMFDRDPDDKGKVVHVSDRWVDIWWGRDVEPSRHHVSQMQKVEIRPSRVRYT